MVCQQHSQCSTHGYAQASFKVTHPGTEQDSTNCQSIHLASQTGFSGELQPCRSPAVLLRSGAAWPAPQSSPCQEGACAPGSRDRLLPGPFAYRSPFQLPGGGGSRAQPPLLSLCLKPAPSLQDGTYLATGPDHRLSGSCGQARPTLLRCQWPAANRAPSCQEWACPEQGDCWHCSGGWAG